MNMVAVPVNRIRRPVSIIGRVVAPVPWRVIRPVSTCPKNVVYDRPGYIHRFVYIIRAIHVAVAHNLYHNVVATVALYFYGCYVLKHINPQYRLYDYQVRAAFRSFYHTKVVYTVVTIKVQV
jgi:hypothetical protein